MVMREGIFHDPVPDGRQGPWLRIRHKRDAGGYAYDERCQACRISVALGGQALGRPEDESPYETGR